MKSVIFKTQPDSYRLITPCKNTDIYYKLFLAALRKYSLFEVGVNNIFMKNNSTQECYMTVLVFKLL